MAFAGRKIALALFTLWGVATLVFFLFTIVPGDSAQMMLGKREDPEALLQFVRNMVWINRWPFNT